MRSDRGSLLQLPSLHLHFLPRRGAEGWSNGAAAALGAYCSGIFAVLAFYVFPLRSDLLVVFLPEFL